jgi:hypothetical protein
MNHDHHHIRNLIIQEAAATSVTVRNLAGARRQARGRGHASLDDRHQQLFIVTARSILLEGAIWFAAGDQ